MGWKFTRNFIDEDRKLYKKKIDGTEDIPFNLYDDDGNLYFEGLISASWLYGDAEYAFNPLDFASANYGCTSMTYYEGGEWKEL